MPELMFRYRAAAFFGRLHTPEIMMGLQSREEVIDVQGQIMEVQQTNSEKEGERMVLMIQNASTVEELKTLEPDVQPEQLDWYNERMTQLTTK
jgi:exonuclease I